MMGRHKMCPVHMVAWWLLFIGGINWGLIGAFDFNLVNKILGSISMLERIVYILVGLSAIAMLFKGKCKVCMAGCGGMEHKHDSAPAAAPGMGGGAPMSH